MIWRKLSGVHPRRRTGRNEAGRLVLGVLVVLLAWVAPAEATFPGANGKIAFTRINPNFNSPSNYDVYTMNANGTDQTNLTRSIAYDTDAAWSPDGSKIAFSSSRDGDDEVYVMNADGTGVTKLTDNALVADEDPAWSPDGTKIAFVDYGRNVVAGSLDAEIYTMNADGTDQTNITNSPTFDTQPAWSPDGQKIAFRRSSELYTMNADGTDQTFLAAGTVGEVADPNWSPDGSRIAFYRRVPGNCCGRLNIFTIDVESGVETNLTPGALSDVAPAWSPDGNKLAFTWNEREIHSIAADGTGEEGLTNNDVFDREPDWQPLIDNDPPDCSNVKGSPRLSPADRTMHLIKIVGGTDRDGDTVSYRITGVTQDELVKGRGDFTSPDAIRASLHDQVYLRAERRNGGDGRVYRITYIAFDGKGSTCMGTAKVVVPRGHGRKRGKRARAVDSAPPSYDSFAP